MRIHTFESHLSGSPSSRCPFTNGWLINAAHVPALCTKLSVSDSFDFFLSLALALQIEQFVLETFESKIQLLSVFSLLVY